MDSGSNRIRGKRAIVVAVAVAVGIVVAGMAGLGIYAFLYKRAAGRVSIGEVDLSEIRDGIYRGSYRVFHDSATVEVVVEDHEIKNIAASDHPFGEESEEQLHELLGRVLSEQKVDVDTVSGATCSQKVTLKAIENALRGSGR